MVEPKRIENCTVVRSIMLGVLSHASFLPLVIFGCAIKEPVMIKRQFKKEAVTNMFFFKYQAFLFANEFLVSCTMQSPKRS